MITLEMTKSEAETLELYLDSVLFRLHTARIKKDKVARQWEEDLIALRNRLSHMKGEL
jgi:hypothetical protein